MIKLISRRNVHGALESSEGIASFCLATLIVFNVVAVVLESIVTLQAAYDSFFTTFEIISVSIFAIEYMIRFSLADLTSEKYKGLLGRIRFFFTPLAVIDLIAIFPFFLNADLRMLRVVRIMKLYRYSIGLQIFVYILREKQKEFLSVFLILIIALLLSSTALYSFRT